VPAARATAPHRVVAARTATAVAFALNGLAFATWVSRIPEVQAALGLTPGLLGVLLLCAAVGAVTALPMAGAVVRRLGTARTVAAGALLLGAGLTLAGVAAGALGDAVLTGVGLFATGYGIGTWDVAMNLEGAVVERRLGRTIMPRFHAAFSLGSVVGAGLGAAAAGTGLPVAAHLSLSSAALVAAVLVAVRSFLPQDAAPADAAPDRRRYRAIDAWREPRTLMIGAVVCVMAFTEGTANDWIAVAFVDGYGTTPAVGALMFGAFVAAMTLGRTVGTSVIDRWGRVPSLAATMLLAVAGGLLTVFAPTFPLAVVGVLVWGLGASLGFPMGMSAAADDEERASARVSTVATIGYTAFLAGPPLVGFLGDQVGVLRALLVVPVLVLPALALAPAMRPLPAPPGAEDGGPGDRAVDGRDPAVAPGYRGTP
jgi:fucose permease